MLRLNNDDLLMCLIFQWSSGMFDKHALYKEWGEVSNIVVYIFQFTQNYIINEIYQHQILTFKTINLIILHIKRSSNLNPTLFLLDIILILLLFANIS